ncbi:M23 family metallopeptidase [Alkalihalobacillus deserti]|uniref:M23 family metallopeptidase n=1 Tax=Alkalihalobacillus deserti TaxID=2879466 RepID=UPI001D14D63C|nr:M23 family metallopeptidase [Alkalihalobacillus deserti]
MRPVKNLFCIILSLFLFVGCQWNENEAEDNIIQPLNKDKHNLANMSIPINITETEVKFLLDDFTKIVGGEFEFDSIHRTLNVNVNHHSFSLTDGVPVLEKDGKFLATDEIYLITDENENIYLPVEFIEVALNTGVTIENEHVHFQWLGTTQQVSSTSEVVRMEDWDADQMVSHLSFLEKPIEGAEVSKIAGHLPGAPRAYRNGFHEGIDWYAFASGGGISTDTPVYAMGNGIVVRADHGYEEYDSVEARNLDLAFTNELGMTPEYIIDRLRGRQVWVQYQGGVLNRFAHLHDIPSEIQVGNLVTAETVIGYVGNSGTSDGVNQNYEEGLHLHQDILIFGEYFWKYLSQDETLKVLERIWE